MPGKDLIVDPATLDFSRVIADLEEIRKYNRQRFEMEQLKAIVTIQPIDAKVPSVTIKAEGSVMSFKIEGPKNLTGFKTGDKVQVTYTRALAISVEAPKK